MITPHIFRDQNECLFWKKKLDQLRSFLKVIIQFNIHHPVNCTLTIDILNYNQTIKHIIVFFISSRSSLSQHLRWYLININSTKKREKKYNVCFKTLIFCFPIFLLNQHSSCLEFLLPRDALNVVRAIRICL